MDAPPLLCCNLRFLSRTSTWSGSGLAFGKMGEGWYEYLFFFQQRLERINIYLFYSIFDFTEGVFFFATVNANVRVD